MAAPHGTTLLHEDEVVGNSEDRGDRSATRLVDSRETAGFEGGTVLAVKSDLTDANLVAPSNVLVPVMNLPASLDRDLGGLAQNEHN